METRFDPFDFQIIVSGLEMCIMRITPCTHGHSAQKSSLMGHALTQGNEAEFFLTLYPRFRTLKKCQRTKYYPISSELM